MPDVGCQARPLLGPVFESYQQNVHTIAVCGQSAGRVEEELEHPIVRRDLGCGTRSPALASGRRASVRQHPAEQVR